MVAGELGHYKELLGILHDQVENVTVETGEAVLDILTRLNEIDQLIQDMIAFLNQAGTSETMADLMDRTESRLATNLRLLDDSTRLAMRPPLKAENGWARSRVWSPSYTGSSDRFASFRSRPTCLRSMPPSKRPGLVNSAKLRRGGFRSQRRRRHARETRASRPTILSNTLLRAWTALGYKRKNGNLTGGSIAIMCPACFTQLITAGPCVDGPQRSRVAQQN